MIIIIKVHKIDFHWRCLSESRRSRQRRIDDIRMAVNNENKSENLKLKSWYVNITIHIRYRSITVLNCSHMV